MQSVADLYRERAMQRVQMDARSSVARKLTKAQAVALLGGDPDGKGPPSLSRMARRIGVSIQAVHQWPDVLTQRMCDRVFAVLWREHAAVLANALTTEHVLTQGIEHNEFVPEAPKRRRRKTAQQENGHGPA